MPKTARAVPRIKVWSRHSSPCDKKDRNYTRCGCPKQLVWHYNGEEKRQSADTNDAEVAERRAREIEKKYERAAYGIPEPEDSKRAILLSEAIDLFIAAKNGNVKQRHFRKLRFEFEQRMLNYFTPKGLLLVSDITLLAIEQWEGTWTGKLSSRKQRRAYIREFFKWAANRNLIEKNPCEGLMKMGGDDDGRRTKPLTEDQFRRLLEATAIINGKTTDAQRTKLHALLRLMRWSGLAIRDAVSLERHRLKRDGDNWGQLFLRRTKTGTDVNCTLPPDVAEELLALPAGRYFFIDSLPSDQLAVDRILKPFQYLFNKLEEMVQFKKEDGEGFHSHRLRDTFAVWALDHDMSMEEVMELLGHTSILTAQKHYASFDKRRAARLGNRMKAAHAQAASESQPA